jgi:transcriptional regulator with XRE-family HTH domain
MAKPLIGRTVRRLRAERGLTQQGLAARLGISVIENICPERP